MTLIIRNIFILLILLVPSFTGAQQLKNTHEDWNFITAEVEGKEVCYILSTPIDSKGNFKFRGDVYFIVSNNNDKADEINVSSGYFYKEGNSVGLEFPATSNKKIKAFKLFSKDKSAWARTSEEDFEIIDLMKERSFVLIKGTSSKGTISSDKYSLKGFAKAYDEMKKACGDEEKQEVKEE